MQFDVLTDEEIAELLERWQRGTPAPYRSYKDCNTGCWTVDNWSPKNGNYGGLIVAGFGAGVYSEENSEKYVIAHETLPAALREIQRLRLLADRGFELDECLDNICRDTWEAQWREAHAEE